ncbi:lysophospholipid acyltransferase family protein [Sporomusa aerivorans]|uniref:lysophospholipid acyltransferase family protein n=1 Tax=Sporomusa aerivorans TaxID=204936 RepID=UPI00352A1E15
MKPGIYKAASRIKRNILGWLQTAAASVVVHWILKGSASFDSSGIKDIKPPFIVLGNHTSFLDPALVQCAIAEYPCYFLTTNFYFRQRVIGSILRLCGAIPKIQFLPDVRSTRGALAAIARGDVVGIFPEGRRSIDGSCCDIPESVARFIKKMKVPVVAVKTNGGYLAWPRWSAFWRRGRVETVAGQILSPADIDVLDAGQIYSIVCQALTYNDYDWNRLARNRYSHQRAAEKLQLILHQCPRCSAEQSMRSKGRELYCSACGNAAIVDEYGFLEPADPTCVVFADPVKWTAWQREYMSEQVHDKKFLIQALVTELRVADKFYGSFRSCGCGYVSLRQEGLFFHGRVDGEAADLFFPIERLPTISTEFEYDFEVCDDKHAWWIFLGEEQQTVRLESAISLLYQLNTGKC